MNAAHKTRSIRTSSQPSQLRASVSREEIITSAMNAADRPDTAVIQECSLRPPPVLLHQSSRIPAAAHPTHVPGVVTHVDGATKVIRKNQQPKRFGSGAAVETYLFRDTTLQSMNATHNTRITRTDSKPSRGRASASREEIITSAMNAATRLNTTVIVESHRYELPFHLHETMCVSPVSLFNQMPIVRRGKTVATTAMTKNTSRKQLRTAK